MNHITGNSIGTIHLIASLLAMITGLFVLVTTKGTRRHKKIGYVYAASMIILNITAFMIFRLYGKFGLFHWMAIVSSLTLFAGLVPFLFIDKKKYMYLHLSFMYWSVIGLYCAFAAEVFSRLPQILEIANEKKAAMFYQMIGVATTLVMIIGAIFYIRSVKTWTNRFVPKKKS